MFVYVPQLSPAAETVVGSICWHTIDTILKLCSSGFAYDLKRKMQELQKYDAILHDIITRFEAEHETGATDSPNTDGIVAAPNENHPAKTEIPPSETVTAYHSSCPQTTDTYETALVSYALPHHKTNFALSRTTAADHFLKPGEIFDADTGRRMHVYHNNRGDCELHTYIGNTNVRVGTNAASIFNFIRALCDWLCDSVEIWAVKSYTHI